MTYLFLTVYTFDPLHPFVSPPNPWLWQPPICFLCIYELDFSAYILRVPMIYKNIYNMYLEYISNNLQVKIRVQKKIQMN